MTGTVDSYPIKGSDPTAQPVQLPDAMPNNETEATFWCLQCSRAFHDSTHPGHLRVGIHGNIQRWITGSTVRYTFLAESFPSSALAAFAAAMLVEARHMWKDIGVVFEHVCPDSPATFQVVYVDTPDSHNQDILASAFFPNVGPAKDRILYIYQSAFTPGRIKYMANVFAHEIGHILGLRHELARCWLEPPSVSWGRKNRDSVMSYHSKLRKFRVQKQDRADLRSFYASNKRAHKGLPIRKLAPPLHRY